MSYMRQFTYGHSMLLRTNEEHFQQSVMRRLKKGET